MFGPVYFIPENFFKEGKESKQIKDSICFNMCDAFLTAYRHKN